MPNSTNIYEIMSLMGFLLFCYLVFGFVFGGIKFLVSLLPVTIFAGLGVLLTVMGIVLSYILTRK